MPARNAIAVLALVSCAGCLVVPVQTVNRRVVGRGETGLIYGPTGALVAQAALRDSVVEITASTERACWRHRFDIVEVTHRREPGLDVMPGGGGSSDLEAGLYVAVAIVAFPISVIVTAIVVAATDDKTTYTRVMTHREKVACPKPVDRVSVRLPSGTSLDVFAHAAGKLVFELPASEPSHGVFQVTDATGTRLVPYFRDRVGCVALREALYARALAAPNERVSLLRTLPACIGSTQAELDLDRVWQETATAAIDAATGNCDSTARLAPTVRALDPVHHDNVFVREPDIARCLSTAATRPPRDTCRKRRSEILRAAQQITDREARGRMLQSAPTCQ